MEEITTKHTFRGWIRKEGEHIWTPLYLLPSEEDPDLPDYIEDLEEMEKPDDDVLVPEQDLAMSVPIEYDKTEHHEKEPESVIVSETNPDKVRRKLFSEPTCSYTTDHVPVTNVTKLRIDNTTQNIHDLDRLSQTNYDSDSLETDSGLFNENRIRNKKKRHERRNEIDVMSNLHVVPGNAEFRDGFIAFLKTNNIATPNKDNSTVSKAVKHICEYPDSLLADITIQNPTFRLNQLTCFKSKDLVQLEHPLDWITRTCAQNPSRATEKLKSHANLRKYIKYLIGSTRFENNSEDAMKKHAILDNLDRIEKNISDAKLFQKYKLLINTEKMKKKKIN